jgi:hypothetical protein
MTLLEDPETRESAPPKREPGRGKTGWFATICALVALAAAAIGLFWDFAPQFRPDPLEVIGADVTIAAVEPDVTLEDWLRKARPNDYAPAARELFGREPSASELALNGHLVYVRIQVDGHKHKDVALSYRVFNARSQTDFVPLGLPDEAASRLRHAQLEAPSERSVQLLWIPSLEQEGDTFIRVELTSERGLLAVTDSGTLHNGRLRR